MEVTWISKTVHYPILENFLYVLGGGPFVCKGPSVMCCERCLGLCVCDVLRCVVLCCVVREGGLPKDLYSFSQMPKDLYLSCDGPSTLTC